jgi:hypothetical protein
MPGPAGVRRANEPGRRIGLNSSDGTARGQNPHPHAPSESQFLPDAAGV